MGVALHPRHRKTYVAQDPARRAYWYPDFGNTTLLDLNTAKKPFDDKNVRKAISMAIDRQRIVTEAVSGDAPPADATGLAESQKRWKNATAQAATWTQRNVAEANRLLDAAGLARGADGIRSVPGGGRCATKSMRSLAGPTGRLPRRSSSRSFAGVGIAATAAPLPYQAWSDQLQKGHFDMGIWSSTRGPTPYQFYRGQLDADLVRPIGEEATDNFPRFASADAGPILRRFEAASDPEELLALSGELQKIYVENAPSLPLLASPLLGRLQHLPLRRLPRPHSCLRGGLTGSDRRAARARGDRSPLIDRTRPATAMHRSGAMDRDGTINWCGSLRARRVADRTRQQREPPPQ